MLNENTPVFENNLKSTFESGYSNAAASLSQLTKLKSYFNNFHYAFHRLDSEFFNEHASLSRKGEHILITTEIFGNVTGKSYLFLSKAELDLLTAGIPVGSDPDVNLKEEFLKELDNILSASVITRLSNELHIKMHGNIPILAGKVNGKIEDIIYDDFNEQTEEVYINSIFFSFENEPLITPFFIWVIDSDITKSLVSRSVA